MAEPPNNEGRDTHAIGRSRSLVPTTVQVSYGPQPGGSGWFGPLAPAAPSAPVEVKGRILDYASGYNLQQRTRPYEGVSFEQLRAFADSYDLLRLVIETRKDQLGRMKWNIIPRVFARLGDAVDDDAEPDLKALDAKAIEITKFFLRPDKENFWDEWLRMILEDMFVLDAATVFRRRTNGGELYALQPLDGGTIKRVIDDYGNTPEAPATAYQQILKGLPAVDYTTEDLLYRPRNKRTHKIFGYSPVEQIIMTINIALRRQVWQLQSFTEGNIPEALIGTPATWTPDQVRAFQDSFDAMLSGNTAERRRAKFVPGEISKAYVATKPDELFGAAEDWMARVVCFAFSISPQPFIKMMNRATAETAQETAVEEGLVPIQTWIKNLIDTIIIDDFGCEDLEFKWADEDELDPKIKSDIDTQDLGSGKRTFNEVRVEAGLDKIDHPNADRPMFKSLSGYSVIFPIPEEEAAAAEQAAAIAGVGAKSDGDGPPGADDGDDPNETADEEVAGAETADDEVGAKAPEPKGAAAKSDLPFDLSGGDSANTLSKAAISHAHGKSYVDPERAPASKVQRRLKIALAAALKAVGRSVAAQVAKKFKGLGKADTDHGAPDIDEILRSLHIEFDGELEEDFRDQLEEVYRTAGEAGLAQLGVEAGEHLTNQVNERAVSWARDNAANLVGNNEDSEYYIGDATREMLRGTITQGLEDNLSSEEIADLIEEGYAFSEERAELIAMTEVASANSQGALASYEEAKADGISLKKSWLILDDACDDCQENEAAGSIDLDEDFPSGDSAPPAHPNCRCVLVPEVEDADGNTEEGDAEEGDD